MILPGKKHFVELGLSADTCMLLDMLVEHYQVICPSEIIGKSDVLEILIEAKAAECGLIGKLDHKGMHDGK